MRAFFSFRSRGLLLLFDKLLEGMELDVDKKELRKEEDCKGKIVCVTVFLASQGDGGMGRRWGFGGRFSGIS